MEAAKLTKYAILPDPESALTVDFKTTGLRKQRHLCFFEDYLGEFAYNPEEPVESRLTLKIDAASVTCKMLVPKPSANEKLKEFALATLRPERHRWITFNSNLVSPKLLRGFCVEGELSVRGVSRAVRANAVIGVPKNDRLQLDADAIINLENFSLPAYSSLGGLVKGETSVLLRALLWCTRVPADA